MEEEEREVSQDEVLACMGLREKLTSNEIAFRAGLPIMTVRHNLRFACMRGKIKKSFSAENKNRIVWWREQ